MILPNEAIQQFKEIYREEYGKDISSEDAIKKANNLIEFITVVMDNSIDTSNLKGTK